MGFTAQARAKFPFATIRGDGRFAAVFKSARWAITLYKTRRGADDAVGRRCAHFVVELDLPYTPNDSPIAPSSGIDWDSAD